MLRRGVAALAVATAALVAAPVLPPVGTTPAVARAAGVAGTVGSGAGAITLLRARDPQTRAPGILVTYAWDGRFDSRYDARVRLYQDRRLVGRIAFLRGWSKARAFFRTSSAPRRHTFRAVGLLRRPDGSVVAGSVERSDRVRWRVVVRPGQVTH